MNTFFRKVRNIFSAAPSNYEEAGDDFVQPRSNNEQLPFNRFASILPYTAYDADTQLFVIEGEAPNKIEGMAFTIEVTPQIGASREMADFLVNLFPPSAPAGTGYQIQMFGTPILDGLTQAMLDSTVGGDQDNQSRLLRKMAIERANYYTKGAKTELFDSFNYRMRNYRSNISVVVPVKDISDEASRREVLSLRQSIITTLGQYNLYGYVWDAEDLINYCAMVLNPHRLAAGDHPWITYDNTVPLREQMIHHDTRAVEEETDITYTGANCEPVALRAMSVRNYPPRIGLNHMGELLGSSTASAIAYPCPFLITCGITLPNYESEKNATMVKSARAQQTAESQIAKFLPHLQDINEDWKLAQRSFDEGRGVCKMYHQLLLFSEPDQLQRCEQAAKAVWRAERFDITTDRKMQKQGLLASLPMMFGPLMQKDLKTAHRISTKTLFNGANMMPVIAEWTGTPPRPGDEVPLPMLTLFGRKGQAMTIDIFANPSGNYNGCVVGTSGSGKSFFLNDLAQRVLATGGRVWILDIGRSYQKLAAMLGGQYIEFHDKADISLNPFSMVENIDEDMELLLPLIAQMISPSRPLNDFEMSCVQQHIRNVWFDHGPASSIAQLADSLINNCEKGGPNVRANDPEWQEEFAKMTREQKAEVCDPRIRDLGVQLFPYTTEGSYGKYFNGPMNIDFKSNFIVLELEELKAKKDLQSVVMLLLMYRITQDMYVSDRKQAKLVLIDEAWDLMSTGSSGNFIEAGYRRARKYGGSFFTATQSVDDYFKSDTAQAAFLNADWMFLLRQKPESIESLDKSGKLLMDEYTKTQLRSVTTVQGKFSEVFIRGGDMPPSIGRLFADPFSLLTASSRADDFEAVRHYVDQGLPTDLAVEAVLRDRSNRKLSRAGGRYQVIEQQQDEQEQGVYL